MRASFSTGLGFTGSSLPAGGGDGSGLFALMGDRGLRGGDARPVFAGSTSQGFPRPRRGVPAAPSAAAKPTDGVEFELPLEEAAETDPDLLAPRMDRLMRS